jgi:CubicO group peptidase (beta-lactamase class C family)
MGWMQGFPPPPDRQIVYDGFSFFSFPQLRWSVCHLRELLPTESISRGVGAPLPLPRLAPSELEAVRSDIDALRFRPAGSEADMTWEASLSVNYTDGILILHRGVIVYERYFGCLAEDRKHAAMSMTKSITGLLAEMLIAEGALKEDMTVREIIPEVGNSAFANATVRQVMDMTTDVAFSEDYADPNADIWLYSAAASPLPKPAGYSGPDGYWEYLQQVRGGANHGQQFGYRTINSDMLGWIVSRVAGQPITDLASQRLWRPMGAEQDAYMNVDAKGVPFAGGGLSAGLRDLGRIGLLLLNEGRLHNRRIFPAAVSQSIRQGGDPARFSGFPTLAGASYRSQWWVLHDDHGSFAARGVHGQTVYIDPTAEMVLVRFASAPRAKNAYLDPTSLPAYRAVADYLLAQD